MITQIIKVTYYLLPLILILGFYFYVSYQKLKKLEIDRLQFLYAEIASEKNIKHQLKNTPKEVKKISATTQHKLYKIKVAVFNIDFSVSEIFS